MNYENIKTPLKEYILSISDNLFNSLDVEICNCSSVKHITFKVDLNWDKLDCNHYPVFCLNNKFTKDIQIFFKMICPKSNGFFNFHITNYRSQDYFLY